VSDKKNDVGLGLLNVFRPGNFVSGFLCTLERKKINFPKPKFFRLRTHVHINGDTAEENTKANAYKATKLEHST